MKNNYKTHVKKISLMLTLLVTALSYAQDINFTFANAQTTNDGTDTYYEADVLIQTINATGSFKLGSGQLYFTYNTAAFGENVKANGRFTVTQPNAEGYICGQYIDAAPAPLYGTFTINDNTTSRVSWAFSQAFSASTFADDNVTETPKKLIHIKFKYIDANQVPMVAFEDGDIYIDQFFTACDSGAGGAYDTPDCTNHPGIQLLNDSYDSSMATLSITELGLKDTFKLYPNPASGTVTVSSSTSIEAIEMYNVLGKQVLKASSTNQLDISALESGVYFVIIKSARGESIKKLIKQ